MIRFPRAVWLIREDDGSCRITVFDRPFGLRHVSGDAEPEFEIPQRPEHGQDFSALRERGTDDAG
jgi:hypothetical protein